jgi:hypothetical protein
VQFEISHGLAELAGLWETGGMKKPELTDVGWLGPKDEMDRASHRFGKCSECHEIICVEKVVIGALLHAITIRLKLPIAIPVAVSD